MIKQPRICAVITENDPSLLDLAKEADLYEVRLDLVGEGWQELVKSLDKPWIACNRHPDEGGKWKGGEAGRVKELLKASEMGANIIDIELRTEGLLSIIKLIKKQSECLVSYHDFQASPTPKVMQKIIEHEREAGADICKLAVTARSIQDNLEVLKMNAIEGGRTVAFAMGPLGVSSRILCPLTGGDFTYASIAQGKESADGQITVFALRSLYSMINA